MYTGTGLDYLMGLSVFELREIVKEVNEFGKSEKQRIRNGYKNRW